MAGGEKRRKEGTEYRVALQDSATVSWHAVECETVAHGNVLAREYIKIIDSGQQGAGRMDVPTVGSDDEEPLDDPDWLLV